MKISSLLIILSTSTTLFLLSGCHMGDSSHMSDSQLQQMQSEFDEMQQSFETMMKSYQNDTIQTPPKLRTLYDQMREMHHKMEENHNHTMTNHRHQSMGQDSESRKMMVRQMHSGMQDRMTQEWYDQMKSMHQQMAQEHQQNGHSEIAKQHKQQGQHFQQLLEMIPTPKQVDDEPVNEQGNPDMLNEANLYAQNCASCHGNNGQGIGNAFPPLVDTEWVTGDKTIPVRIIRDGLTGEIEVDGKIYDGSMPSFKARLSLAEIAAIVNYLREISAGDHPSISQDDIIQISNSYGDRDQPWKAEDLLDKK